MSEPLKSYWDVLLPKFESINVYETAERYFSSCADAGRPIVFLYATHMCASEVHNGGFLQLFWNSTGISVPEAVEGYRAMGMNGLAELVESTARLLGDPYPRNRDDRWDALLVSSGRTSEDLEAIFKRNENLYLAFQEATAPLNFDPLDREFWHLAGADAGGYQEAATRYAQSLASD